jgi:hypothetical protein
MENFHLQAKSPANREPNFAPLLPLVTGPKSSNFAFHSLVILHLRANPVGSLSLRRRFSARHLVDRSGY